MAARSGASPGERRFSGDLGFRFTVGTTPLTVTSLGIYDGGTAGLTETHTIRLYLASNMTSPIASSSVDSSTPGDAGNYIYALDLATPITLAANTTYALLTNFMSTASSDVFLDLDDGTEPQGIGSGGSESPDTGARFTTDAGSFIAMVNTGLSPTVSGYGGPNAQYVVPEPASLGLLGGVAMLALGRRKRALR